MLVERLWRSVKYEAVSFPAYESIRAAPQGLGRSLTCSNPTRPPRALDGKTPAEVSGDNLTPPLTAAESAHREAPLKEWNLLSKQLRPPLRASRCPSKSIKLMQ